MQLRGHLPARNTRGACFPRDKPRNGPPSAMSTRSRITRWCPKRWPKAGCSSKKHKTSTQTPSPTAARHPEHARTTTSKLEEDLVEAQPLWLLLATAAVVSTSSAAAAAQRLGPLPLQLRCV